MWQKKIFWKKRFVSDFLEIFWDFFLRIGLDWRALVKRRSPNIEKQRGFFCWTIFFLIKEYWEKKSNFWMFSPFLILFEFLWFSMDFFFNYFFNKIFFKVIEVTTKSFQGDYWTPKMASNGPKHYDKFFFSQGQK